MKYVVIDRVDWVQLGRGCVKCEKEKCGKPGSGGCQCQCKPDSTPCNAGVCKCDRTCSCTIDTYRSAYEGKAGEWVDGGFTITWTQLGYTWFDMNKDGNSISQRRHHCAQILLGSVCLIWSGITYMHWTGKYHSGSSYWNNHILDGTGLDDGTLSQWLQALGFPREMLNDKGPKNRLDQIIWDGFMGKLFLGFTHPTISAGASDGNTAKQPYWMNYAGFVHTAHRDSFNKEARVFNNGDDSSTTQDNDTKQHKIGAIFKLYILSCAYFTGLQKQTSESTHSSTSNTPKTIREILYWLSALPYSQAYKDMLDYSKGRLKEVTKKPGDTDNSDKTPTLAFLQEGRSSPITVHEYNLFAHFQAVTQYCPLVLIGIQGGLHSAKGTDSTKDPAIHSLYANTECNFTYPTVSIQAYNQVVHYIRALFYQLYFLRKQCAVKVTCGGKWRECRYGHGVVSKGVISWMCLGCSPMEHDRKSWVDELKMTLGGMKTGSDSLISAMKAVLENIGEVVVQLGNAQEALERRKGEEINKVKGKLGEAKTALEKARTELEKEVKKDGLNGKELLQKAKDALGALTNGGGILKLLEDKLNGNSVTDPGKNEVSKAIHKVREILGEIQKELGVSDSTHLKGTLPGWVATSFHQAIDRIKDICNSAKCHNCDSHSTKCGQKGTPTMCKECGNMTTTGVPSPLQAFLEDRLPGFSCEVVRNDDKNNPDYPSAASHLGHCGGSGQCCPLPMGFRGQFQKGITQTGKRLYGILYFFSNENMMQSCVYTLVRVTAELSATTPQVLGDVFGFFRGGVGNGQEGMAKGQKKECDHSKAVSEKKDEDYFCGWCASGLRDEVKSIGWIPKTGDAPYRDKVGDALINIKGDKGTANVPYSNPQSTTNNLSTLTSPYLSPLTGELYTAVSATFGGTYLSWVLYLSDALEGGLRSLASAFQQIECRGCKGQCDPNKCKKGEHGQGSGQCGCQSIVSCTGVLPVLYRHGFSYGNPFNLEGYQQKDEKSGDYSITGNGGKKQCHEFLESLNKVLEDKKGASQQDQHPLTNLLTQVGKLQYDIRLPWIFVLAVAWLAAVLYLAFGAIWPLDWVHMRSHWLRGGEHQWQCMWYKVMTGRKGVELMEYFGQSLLVLFAMV